MNSEMAGVKRSHDGSTEDGVSAPESPFIPMFEAFRTELDEHHDRRERIIKASRDITALSKKMIFTLQRVRKLKAPVQKAVASDCDGKLGQVKDLFSSITGDLQGINAWRYQRQISGGIQEFMEAATFRHYLERQNLLQLDHASGMLPGPMVVTAEDYLLGIFDLVGELMRFAITCMATNGSMPGSDRSGGSESSILADLQVLRGSFEGLDVPHKSGMSREVEKKMEVMRTCVEKVEASAYGMIIRGRERPKGWMPDLSQVDAPRDRDAIEIY